MPDVHPACQSIADELAAQQAQSRALAAQAEGLTGAAAWETLAELGRIRADEAAKQRELDACLAANSATLSGTLTIIDVRPGPPPETHKVVLWDVDQPAGPAIAANMSWPMFGFNFPGAIPETKAVTVQSVADGAAVGAGFDFRTGPLPANEKNLPIEILFLPAVTFDEASINAWASTVQLPVQQMSAPGGGATAPVNVGPTTFSVSLATGSFVVVMHTVVTGTGGAVQLVSATPHPVSATLPVTVLPDMNPVGDPAAPVSIKVGDPTSIHDGGLFGGMAAALVPLVFGSVRGQFEQQISSWLNAQLPNVVAAAFALDALPTRCTITVRSIEVTMARMSLAAVVGNLGDALRTFQPHGLNP
jgi:hypothetical protein